MDLQNITVMSQGVSRTLLERAMDLSSSSSSPIGIRGKSQRELNISSQRDYSMMREREKDQDERDLYGNYLDEKYEKNEFA